MSASRAAERDDGEEERAPRVSQVDAQELDDGLVGMMASKLTHSLAALNPGSEHRFAPEISLLLKLAIYRFGVLQGEALATPGMRLQGVKFAGERRRSAVSRKALVLYFLLSPSFLPAYLLARLKSYALSHSFPDAPRSSWQRRCWVMLDRAEAGGRWIELLGWAAFLFDGRYPNLVARWLRLRLVPSSPFGSVARMVSYEFMNRQLVWNAFTEFLVFALPGLQALQLHRPLLSIQATALELVNAARSRPEAKDYASKTDSSGSRRLGNEKVSGVTKQDSRGPLHHLPPDICAICHTRISPAVDSALGLPLPTTASGDDPLHLQAHTSTETSESRIHIPAKASCNAGCLYCYFCLAGALTAEAKRVEEAEEYGRDGGDGWPCLRCGQGIWSCTRVTAKETGDEFDEGYGRG